MLKTKRFLDLRKTAILSLLFVFLLPMVALGEENKDIHELMIMTTTDIHSYLMPYDYMNDREVNNYGLVKTATLIDQIRAEHENTILFDNGDIFQGSLLGELEANIEPLEPGETQAIIKAFNELDYAAASIGNHEFNFGLDFLDNAIATSDFPWLNANVYKAGTDLETHRFQPYDIIEHEVDGKTIKIGVIGFTPPQIMQWDNLHLQGNVEVEHIVESAQRYVPELAEKTDLVIALAHTGVNTGDRETEHAAVSLAREVEGIDALVMGHAHQTFPGNSRYDSIEGVDDAAGTIHGVPAVMAGSWGSHLGTIQLDLIEEDGVWTVASSKSEVTGVEDVKADQTIVDLITDVHQRTLDYVNSAVGTMADGFNTFFSLVMDNEVLQLVNDAQLWFAEDYLKGTDYEDTPLLSAAAPFRAGYRGGYTEVEAGELKVRDLADIYVYDNTLQVVEVDGDGLNQWIERSAESFRQIDPTRTDDQYLLASFSAFNFDVIEGVEYQIDVTQPIGKRVTNLTYEGEEVTSDMEFLVATNNYRAGGGGDHLAGLDAPLVQSLVSLSVENRYVILDYIQELGEDYTPYASYNWSIKPVDTAGDVLFNSSEKGAAHIDKLGLLAVSATGELVDDADNAAVYTYNFTEEMRSDKQLSFPDLRSHSRGYEQVMSLANDGVIYGYPNGMFMPDNSITRAEAALMMARIKGLDLENIEADKFNDVNENTHAAKAIHAARQAGIFQGDKHNNFHPNAEITRGEVAAILVRAFDLKADSTETNFTDLGSTFETYIGTLYNLGITKGMTDTKYGTKYDITRRDFSILLYGSNHSN